MRLKTILTAATVLLSSTYAQADDHDGFSIDVPLTEIGTFLDYMILADLPIGEQGFFAEWGLCSAEGALRVWGGAVRNEDADFGLTYRRVSEDSVAVVPRTGLGNGRAVPVDTLYYDFFDTVFNTIVRCDTLENTFSGDGGFFRIETVYGFRTLSELMKAVE